LHHRLNSSGWRCCSGATNASCARAWRKRTHATIAHVVCGSANIKWRGVRLGDIADGGGDVNTYWRAGGGVAAAMA